MCSVLGHLKLVRHRGRLPDNTFLRSEKIYEVTSHESLCCVVCVCVCTGGMQKEFPQKWVAMVSVWGLDQVPDHSRALWAIKHTGY